MGKIILKGTSYAPLSRELLELYDKKIKEHMDSKENLINSISTHCPNCGAPITGSKCPYCDTDFEASAMWGKELKG